MSTETTKTRKIKTAAERAADALALEQGRVDVLIRRGTLRRRRCRRRRLTRSRSRADWSTLPQGGDA